MKSSLDTSVLVAALHEAAPEHATARRVLLSGKCVIHAHALSETFSILTGGRLGIRVPAMDAASILKEQIADRLQIVLLTDGDLLDAYAQASMRGVRGGAIHDYLHLVAARKAGTQRLYTLNTNDFRAFSRPGDPEILEP